VAIIKDEVLEEINEQLNDDFFNLFEQNQFDMLENQIEKFLLDLHQGIQETKRSSYGITYVINLLCKSIFEKAQLTAIDPYTLAITMVNHFKDFKTISVGLGILSHVGVNQPEKVVPLIIKASNHELWEVKEFVQMFLRKITKKHKIYVQNELLKLTESDNANYRRFASEALRPVVENRWIQDDPEFSLKVLRKLFNESDPFPRVSVGNNLSDLSRKNPELILSIVKDLVDEDDENSYFIAHRACRNLVKLEPLRVLDLLNIDVYKYKTKTYKRENYINN